MKKFLLPVLVFLFLLAAAISAEAKDVVVQLGELKYGLASGLLENLLAKELCTCHFTAGLSEKDCIDRGNLPGPTTTFVGITIDEKEKTVRVEPAMSVTTIAPNAPTGYAVYNKQNPRFACVLQDAPPAFPND